MLSHVKITNLTTMLSIYKDFVRSANGLEQTSFAAADGEEELCLLRQAGNKLRPASVQKYTVKSLNSVNTGAKLHIQRQERAK